MSKPRWFQVLTEEDLDSYCQKHSCGLEKNIFRFKSCDVVCLQGVDPSHNQPHVRVLGLFDINSISLDQISPLFDCSQIETYQNDYIALRSWRDCVRSTEGCNKHVGVNSKFCSFACKIEHVLEHEGDLSSITRNWSEDDSRETSEHVGDLSIHPCGDPERFFPFKKRSRRRRLYDSDDDIYGYIIREIENLEITPPFPWYYGS